MPIRQTPSITEHDRALRLFTDRLAERRLFACALHADRPPKHLHATAAAFDTLVGFPFAWHDAQLPPLPAFSLDSLYRARGNQQ